MGNCYAIGQISTFINGPILSHCTFRSGCDSVTRLGDFCKFPSINCLTKVAQIFWACFVCFEKITLLLKLLWQLFGQLLGKIWLLFSNIWSQWDAVKKFWEKMIYRTDVFRKCSNEMKCGKKCEVQMFVNKPVSKFYGNARPPFKKVFSLASAQNTHRKGK